MPAVGVVASLTLSSVGITASTVGAAALGAAGITASTTVASVVGGTIIGAGTGALSAAVQGGDIGKGALMGAVSGGVGSGISGAVSQALSPGLSTIDLQGANYMPPEVGGSVAVGRGIASGLGRFGGTLAGGLAGGVPFDQALRSGAISGIAGGLGTGIGEATDLGQTGTAILSGALGTGLSAAFGDSGTSRAIAPSVQTGAGPATQYNLGALSQGVQTSGLGSALFAAPGIGYSPGAPLFGTSESGQAPTRNAWGGENKSLRDVGETVT